MHGREVRGITENGDQLLQHQRGRVPGQAEGGWSSGSVQVGKDVLHKGGNKTGGQRVEKEGM